MTPATARPAWAQARALAWALAAMVAVTASSRCGGLTPSLRVLTASSRCGGLTPRLRLLPCSFRVPLADGSYLLQWALSAVSRAACCAGPELAVWWRHAEPRPDPGVP